uniref:Solute carrier family 15 member 2 n=1 Tax=Oreochromis aureus TaxID=47969 RepID=A0A668S7C3_OREAU
GGKRLDISICFIVVNEFCERFSYYGMKALLTLYFLNYLKWDKDLSTAVYHAFSGLCYFTPILGAFIADSWLGKYKTIIYLSIVYVIGHVVKSVGAIPTVGSTELHIALSMSGLILIALGTGGIKPCVAAFGGDQFGEEHTTERQKFFSIFYMSINAGSFLSTIITPILRGDVQCFGGDCYALAFGVPAALMVVALVVFIAGSSLYKRTPPQGNILWEVCNCIGFALKNRWNKSKHDSPRQHWLDWAEEKYSMRLIQEIKMVLRVLVLYIPLPMFWALFDQQGSRWTLQATRMNLAFVRPYLREMLNALLILVFVPIFDLIIYPLVRLCGLKITPLRKMAMGMVFAALAFGAATLVEVNVVKTVVNPAPAGKCLLQVVNLAKEDVSLKAPGTDLFLQSIKYLEDPPGYETVPLSNGELNLEVTGVNGATFSATQKVEEKKAYSVIIYPDAAGITYTLVEDHITKNEDGNPLLRFLNTQLEALNVTVGDKNFYMSSGYNVTHNKTVQRGEYTHATCISNSGKTSKLNLGLLDFGACYTVILTEEAGEIVPHKIEDVKANNVHIAYQIPQYILITAGEVMFSITGLEFSYSQAPANMKSVLQAGWLLTVAFGNVIVLIVAEGAGLEQWIEFLLFACLLLGVCIIFSIMAHFYTYVDPEEMDKLYLENSVKEEDDSDFKKKNNEIQLNKTGKSTRM